MIQIGIIILLTLFVLKELFSFKFDKDDYSITTEELRDEFGRKHLLLLLLFFILLPTIAIGLAIFFNSLSTWSFANDKAIIHLIKTNKVSWFGMAVMSTLGCVVLAMFKISKWIFKSNKSKYWFYYNRIHGSYASGLLKYLGILLVLTSSILVCLHLNSFVKFKEGTIEINQLSFLKMVEYDYDSITKIIQYQKTVAPNGNIVEQAHYAIVFNDNFEWRTNDDLRFPVKNDNAVFSFLIEKTGLKLNEIEIDQ